MTGQQKQYQTHINLNVTIAICNGKKSPLFIFTADPPDGTLEEINDLMANPATSKSSSSKVETCCKRYYCSFIAAVFSVISISLLIMLLKHKHASGNVLLGNSDVLLISAFHPSLGEVMIAPTGDLVPVYIYQGLCSQTRPFPMLRQSTRQLNITENSQYRIDEPYLMGGSHINYSLTESDSATNSTSSSCIAYVHVFIDRLSYLQFIGSGHVSKLSISGCLSLAEPLVFTLPLPSDSQSKYYFVALESLNSNIDSQPHN